MKRIFLFLGLASLVACKPHLKNDTPTANGLDFSNYVAVGNSLTAGYSDYSLFRSGQEQSFPALLADQFRVFGPIRFQQPLLPSDAGWPDPKLVLKNLPDCAGVSTLTPVPYTGSLDTAGSSTNIASQGPFNNFGIPGIRAVDYVMPGYALFNPYAGRMFANPFARPLDEVQRLNPTFFTLWIGGNDVLGYALSGGEGNPTTPFSPDNISDITAFRAGFDSVLSALTKNGAKGVVMNIPEITSLPLFTTIPYDGLVLDTMQAAALNASYAGTGIQFKTGANPFIIQDVLEPLGFRFIKKGEFILLSVPQDKLKCDGWGSMVPIPQSYVLTADEVANIRSATGQFNQHIHDQAILKGLPMMDANAYLKTLEKGVIFNGVNFTTQYITGSMFSLDGVHLTPRGYAMVANRIIQTINDYYLSTIPMIDVNRFDGVKVP